MAEGYKRAPEATERTLTSYEGPERRGKERLYGCFPAMEQDVEKGGEPFDFNAVITNISASGLYVRLMRSEEPGATLFLLMTFASAAKAHGPLLAIHGRVLRVEPQRSGDFGLGVAITYHEFA